MDMPLDGDDSGTGPSTLPLQDAITVLGDTRVDGVLARLALLPERALVVIHREHGTERSWYVHRADELAMMLKWADRAARLVDALPLHRWPTAATIDLGQPLPEAVSRPAVVLHGDRLVGVVPATSGERPHTTRGGGRLSPRPDGGTRGGGTSIPSPPLRELPSPRVPPAPPSGGGARPGRGLRREGGWLDRLLPRGPRPHRNPRPADAPRPGRTVDDRPVVGGGGAAATDDEGSAFRAHPRLEAPTSVRAGVPFVLEVSLAAEAAADAAGGGPIEILDAPAEVPLVVQAFGAGFRFPQGIRRALVVPRDVPDAAVARITVVADPVVDDAPRVLEVSFEYAGNVCGRAWRQIVVGAQAVPAAGVVVAGGGGLATPPLQDTPDLTVEIRAKDGDSVLEWVFHSRYEVPLPDHQVKKDLDRLDAKTFAMTVMADLPRREGTRLLEEAVRGAGREIMTALPTEFWEVLGVVWARARDRGVVPSLLLITEDPYVPWELVPLDDDRFVDPALLAGGDAGTLACLGTLWQVGRWLPPVLSPPGGGNLPPQPPQTRIEVDAMAVVVGDYASHAEFRPLPDAIEEGRRLVERYDAMRLTALEDELKELLSGDLRRGGRPYLPRVVHFACHGTANLDGPDYGGIVLNDGNARLTPMILRGTRLSRAAQPFVFLNACEVGAATQVLSGYGGMAGAFLVEGCRAFLAPLWVIDDVVARDLALGFYRLTLDDGVPVAEAMRRLRVSFGTAAAAGTATPLAYAFYGHPALHLVRSP